MTNRIGETLLIVETGELTFFPAGTCYTSEYSREGTETKIVQFDLMQGELPTYLSAPRKIALPDAGEWMDRFFIPVQAHPFYYLSEIYAFLQRIEEQETRLPAKFRRLQPAMAELEAYLTGNDRVGHYAALCGMSEAGFRRLFREYIGCSPVEYRNTLRLERARTLLQSGEYNVSEAAEQVGFANLSFFIRLYKKKFGYTPKKE
jgi:AraC-like DNA-binding protein